MKRHSSHRSTGNVRNWLTPSELPDLRRVGSVAPDTETRDAGLLRDEPCTRCGEPTPPLDGRVICVRCAPVLRGCGAAGARAP